MKVLILCGGEGRRIRDVSDLVPKPMLPIGQMPILWHIMKTFASHGFTDFVLCLGYKGWVIRDFFINYHAMVSDCTLTLGDPNQIEYHSPNNEGNWKVTLVDTGEKTLTGGRVVRARPFMEGDGHFMLTYGDGLADVDIKALVAQHVDSGKIGTVTAVRMAGRFGELDLDGKSVREFNQKPAVTEGRISGGYFVFDAKRAWDFFEERDDLELERAPLTQITQQGQLGAYHHDGFWQCMDTSREHRLLNDMWAQGRAPWKVW